MEVTVKVTRSYTEARRSWTEVNLYSFAPAAG